MRVLLVSVLLSITGSDKARMVLPEPGRSTKPDPRLREMPLKSLIARIEYHPKGEVFTLNRIETDGCRTNYSIILYLDGEPRRSEDFGCSGIQSSRRADERTVEIMRMCASKDGCGS